MKADTKYLQKRKGVWFIRLSSPPKCWGLKGEFLHTLRTPNLSQARRLRDKYLSPILVESKGIDMANSILRLLAYANEDIKSKLIDLGENLGDESREITVNQAFEKFITLKKKTNSQQATLDAYEASKKSFSKVIDGEKLITQLTTNDVIVWRDTLLDMPNSWLKLENPKDKKYKDKPRLSPTTINNQIERLGSVWKWAKEEKYIGVNEQDPTIGIKAGKSNKVKNTKPLSIEDCNSLMNLKKGSSKLIGEREWKLIPLVARYTGARLAEIAQLTANDIISEKGILCFNITNYDDKETKNSQSVRIVPISDKLKEYIQPILSKKVGLLFPKRGDGADGRICKEFSKSWNRQAKKVGSHCYFHRLRDFVATELKNAGVEKIDRMAILGHDDSSQSSHDGYTKIIMTKLKEAVDKIP